MQATKQGRFKFVNYLSLRISLLDIEDLNGITIFVHVLQQENFTMAQRLLKRGSNINYVNSNGQTALHICIENKLMEQIKFLLTHDANPYIMDLTGRDCCDLAKFYKIDHKFKQLQQGSLIKKIIPMLPDGTHANPDNLPFF